MTMNVSQFAQLPQADLVRLIDHYRNILKGDSTNVVILHNFQLTFLLLSQDPRYSLEEKQEAERALNALYQPTYSPTSSQEHNNRVLGGYRATLANPNVSDAAKAHARAMLEQAGADIRTQKERSSTESGKGSKSPDAHLARQLGGYKSALKSKPILILYPGFVLTHSS